GETIRSIEPYYLIFHWSCWYVYGYCTKRHDYRLFKLNRMIGISIGNNFNKREVSLPIFDNKEVSFVNDKYLTDMINDIK
ncbi:MAG: WYL domain-containing protein, partial [Erysipelotrichaceae bacterium]|nr:WYL domain-containing protein [Erysipelotrichaceae bacterium]